jgi:glycosyltransferase involved in cell wall biosynthesis
VPVRSVVLAAYNGERYIGEQLTSILSQLAAVDEIIVSDDASSDGTVAAVGRHADPRIRMIQNRTRVGYVRNFERAIAQARGDHILFSDQDDVWLPNKVAVVDAALAHKACVVSDAVVVDDALRELHASFFSLRGVRGFSILRVFMKPCFIGATMACRKDYLAAMLPFPPNVPHDFWVTLNATLDDTLSIITEPLILYRRHAATASVSATARRRSLPTIAAERLRLATTLIARRARRSVSRPD